MKKIKLSLLGVGLTATVQAQSVSPDVIASSGDHFEASGVQLSWTIGESIMETVESGSNIITQGFHQTNLMVTDVEEQNLSDIGVNVFPNPTVDQLTVALKNNSQVLNLELYDMSGKQLARERIGAAQDRIQLDFSSYAAAYYLLKVYSKDGEVNNNYKIQKTQ